MNSRLPNTLQFGSNITKFYCKAQKIKHCIDCKEKQSLLTLLKMEHKKRFSEYKLLSIKLVKNHQIIYFVASFLSLESEFNSLYTCNIKVFISFFHENLFHQ